MATYAFANGRQDGTNLPFAGSIQLHGIGVGPVYESSYAPGSAIHFSDVSVGGSTWLPFEIANVTMDDVGIMPQTDMTILDAIISGPDSSSFSLLDFTPGIVLHQSDEADFLFEFAPTPTVGSKWADVTFLTDVGAELGTPGARLAYTLVGVAVPEPGALALLAAAVLILFGLRRQQDLASATGAN